MIRKHVVAIRLGRLGDLVMTVPALQWLAACPTLDVTLVTDARYIPLFGPLLPGIRLVSPDQVQRLKPADLIMDLHGHPRSRKVVARIDKARGLARIIATRKESLRRRSLLVRGRLPAWSGGALLCYPPRLNWPQRHLLAAERAFDRLDVHSTARPPRPEVQPALCSEGPRPGHGPAGGQASDKLRPPILGLSPGASWATKRWPPERFRSLVRLWREDAGGEVRLFGSPEEQPLLLEIAEETGARPWNDPSLVSLVQGLESCDVVVAGDTGPLHLAAALGRPVVGLFGPTPLDAGFWVWADRGLALRVPDLSCSPCSLHGGKVCPRAHHRCLTSLSVQRVAEAARSLLYREAKCVRST